MSDRARDGSPPDRIVQQGADWVLRCDRGLTPSEQDEFCAWLAADPQHGREFARHRQHWKRLDRLAHWRPEHSDLPNPDLLAPPRRHGLRRFLSISIPLAAAAAVALVIFTWEPDVPESIPQVAASSSQRILEDGSLIELNRGAVVTVHYSSTERRINLERGEAYFSVTKDPARPFIVTALGISVRAVGTSFNVRLDAEVAEVLVTEGRVEVDSPREMAKRSGTSRENRSGAPLVPLLEANQRAVVSLSSSHEPPRIATLTPGEIERLLAWQHRLLSFTAMPLSGIVAEFNRRNAVQLVVIDPELASVPISATFRSDNIQGFVHLLEAGFGVRVERRGEFEILLQKSYNSATR
ncbi:MAG TPA: FecR domain-containing protein [Opitutaceae bacterium]